MNTECPVCTSEIDERFTTCPVCGFKLKGSTQQFKPVAVEEAPEPAAPAQLDIPEIEYKKKVGIKLKVIRGPQTGIDIPVDQREYTIGRDPNCGIFLNDMTVSRIHASIVPDGDDFKIIDNKSFNGVWINNRNITESILRKDDIIQIGTFCLQVVL